MILPDANILLNAINPAATQQVVAKAWLDETLNGSERIGLAWVVLLSFLRISTKSAIFPSPLTVSQATGYIQQMLASPNAVIISPGQDHLLTLNRLLNISGTAGNLVTDAHLAVLAIEHGAELVTFDRDFGRFDGLRWKLLR